MPVYVCNICGAQLADLDGLLKHFEEEHGELVWWPRLAGAARRRLPHWSIYRELKAKGLARMSR